MSDQVRALYTENFALGLLTTHFRDFFKDDGESLSFAVRTARTVEGVVLAVLTTAVAAYIIRGALIAFKPGLLIGLAAGVGLAMGGHRIRKTLLLDKRVTGHHEPYNISFNTLYLDAFSILKGKWQVLEATAAAVLGIAILGASLRLSQIHPFATALFAATALGATGAYVVADYLIGRNFRQI